MAISRYNLKELIEMASDTGGEKLNLYQKISAITDAIGIIQKDERAPEAMGGYKFLSHGMVMAHIRRELTKRNVVIVPSGEELLRADFTEKRTPTFGRDGETKTGEKVSYNYRTIIKFMFRVVNGDNPEQYFDASWIGEGMDTQDKGVQKAGTSAEKYFLMKLFKIGDKDDPDAIAGDKDAEEQAPARKATQSVSATLDRSVPPADERPVDVPVANVPPNEKPQMKLDSNGATVPVTDADLIKKQTEALVWFGEQLPPSAGWFKGKIIPMIQVYDVKQKRGTLTDEEKEPGSGIRNVFNQIAKSHYATCGEDCQHITAAQLAVILGGTISDPAR
jgi:hypothetical protein